MSFIGIKISVGEGKVMATACGQTKNLRKEIKERKNQHKVQSSERQSGIYHMCYMTLARL